jgi:hypothetical protein
LIRDGIQRALPFLHNSNDFNYKIQVYLMHLDFFWTFMLNHWNPDLR